MKESDSSPATSGNVRAARDGFPARLAELIGDSSVRAFARKAGVSDTFLRQCLAGRTEPTRTKLLALAHAGNTSVEWLATGMGAANVIAEPGPAPAAPGLDRVLLESVIGSVEQALSEIGRALTPDCKALLVTAVYEMHVGHEHTTISRDEILKLVSRAN